jgi:PAS domain S-box-containing protein
MRKAEALVESEQRLRAIVDTAVDAIITIDERGLIESANPSTQRLFGYRPEELVGRNVSVLMPDPHREEHTGYLRRYLTTGKATIIGIGREVVGLRKDGRTIPIRLSISEVPLKRGRLFTAIIHDVTERRRLESQVLEATATEQRRIGRELHDGICQNMVGAALGISSLSARLKSRCPALAAEAQRIAVLVRETAMQARNLAHGLTPIAIAPDALESALQGFALQTSEVANIRCEAQCELRCRIDDTVTSTHLYRIVQEAVSNAIRHGKASRVRISLMRDAQECVLTVSDNGCGFPKGVSHETGRGLGLQTMAYRARMIGGVLTIGRCDGGGTSVRCAFQCSAQPSCESSDDRKPMKRLR